MDPKQTTAHCAHAKTTPKPEALVSLSLSLAFGKSGAKRARPKAASCSQKSQTLNPKPRADHSPRNSLALGVKIAADDPQVLPGPTSGLAFEGKGLGLRVEG